MVSQRLATSSRRAGRVTNKSRLLVVRGTKEADLHDAEIIVFDDGAANGESTKHQHVGAKGVESGELLEHHLQAALSSASLLHSRPSQPASPTPATRQPKAADVAPAAAAAAGSANAALNYHIPTPDATGLIQDAAYSRLYAGSAYHEPTGFIRFSDTVEEAAEGPGGLGYNMDDRDEQWLTAFNNKAEGGSGESVQSPLKDSKADNSMGPPPTVGRPRREKGKEKEKETPAPVFISEDVFEFIMGVFEKFAEDTVPMLHTNLSLLPDFASIEGFFATSITTSFLPSFEVPRMLPPSKDLVRMAQRVYPHWKERRTERKGKTIMPQLNYDETNDGDPYVCFRRRDVRATRKTRRADNVSIERMQKLQIEMRQAHLICSMVLRRETEKLAQVQVEKDVWEAKWKLYETKRRWPSLGLTREEEELITGKHSRETAMAAAGVVNAAMLGGRDPLSAQRENIPSIRRKNIEKDREEKERRESRAMEAARIVEKGMGLGSGGRSNAPEVLKERMMALRQRLDEVLGKRKAADAEWDDATDSSYQPLPGPRGSHAFRYVTEIDPPSSIAHARLPDDDSEDLPTRPLAFRIRRGRGGVVRLDRRVPGHSHHRGAAPSDVSDLPSWLFPDTLCSRSSKPRPKSIDEVEGMEEDEVAKEDDAKRRRLNEIWRYDVDRGGAVGVGMGVSDDDDRVIIDDLDTKYARHRVTLLQEEDMEKLRPDISALAAARIALDAPLEMPPTPIFNRPQVAQQPGLPPQQMIQQQQIEQFQRYQLMAQQQAMAAQQQAAIAGMQNRVASGDAPANGAASPAVNGMGPPNGRPPLKRPPSAQNGTPVPNGMPPPNLPRPSLSPTNTLQSQSPQMVNGVPMPPQQQQQKPFVPPNNLANVDPQLQQRILAARAMQNVQTQAAAQAAAQMNGQGMPNGIMNAGIVQDMELPTEELTKLAHSAGYGNNIQAFIDARNRARLITATKQQQQLQQYQQQHQQQQQQVQQQVQVPQQNGTPGSNQQYPSPQLPTGQLQLKLPAHAAARLGAANTTPQPQRA